MLLQVCCVLCFIYYSLEISNPDIFLYGCSFMQLLLNLSLFILIHSHLLDSVSLCLILSNYEYK